MENSLTDILDAADIFELRRLRERLSKPDPGGACDNQRLLRLDNERAVKVIDKLINNASHP